MRTVAANSNQGKKPAKTVGDIVSQRHFPTFFENDFVKVILPILQESDIPAACVIDEDGRLKGLLTERAILRYVFAKSTDSGIHAANLKKHIEDMMVFDVMIPGPETLDSNLPVEEAAGVMLRRGYRFMPVVDCRNRRQLLGIVSEREIAAQLRDSLEEVRTRERSSREMLSFMLCEPYGSGYREIEA